MGALMVPRFRELKKMSREVFRLDKIESVDFSVEEMAKRLFPGREVSVFSISKRISNDGKTVHGWRVEFRELKNGNQGSG